MKGYTCQNFRIQISKAQVVSYYGKINIPKKLAELVVVILAL